MEDRDDALNALRIRQTATLRRGLYRMRSYAIIAAGVSAVASLQLIVAAVRQIRGVGINGKAVGYFIFAILCGFLIVYFVRRCTELNREARENQQTEPTEPPDFSTLGDGRDIQEKFDRIE